MPLVAESLLAIRPAAFPMPQRKDCAEGAPTESAPTIKHRLGHQESFRGIHPWLLSQPENTSFKVSPIEVLESFCRTLYP
jgi:hypothetical protein